MEENDLQAGDSEDENLRAMEKDIDEFLSSIRENVSKSTEPENEVTCSDAHQEYDSISSDDCFENDALPSKSNKPLTEEGHARKLSHRSTLKTKYREKKGSEKNLRHDKLWNNGRFGQSSEDEYHHHHQHHHSFHPSWRDSYDSHRSLSPRGDYRDDRSVSPRSDRSSSYRERERQEGRSMGLDRRGTHHHHQAQYIPREKDKYRRGFYPEQRDEVPQDRRSINERNFHRKRTIPSRSRSSDEETLSQRAVRRSSNSPLEWSESYDYDSDFDDRDADRGWRREDYPDIEEDRDGQNSTSLIIACLQKAIAYNPDIATKVTQACIALLNEPSDEPPEIDYDCDRDSWAGHDELSGRVSLHGWRNSRSPSFSESPGASSSRSGFTYHSDRFHSHTKRRISERSLSPFDKQARREKYDYQDSHKKTRCSPEHKRKDVTRSSTAAASSKTQRERRRSSSDHAKSHHEEEFNLKGAVSWSIRKIRKQCKEESSSTVRRALLSLLEVHERECKMYLRKPEAHPDHEKEYREFVVQKTKSIIDLGGDPNGYNFEQDWKKHWPMQMYKHFQESWKAKMQKCTSLLQKKYGSYSNSSQASSRKSSVKDSSERKQKRSTEEVDTRKSSKKVKTSTLNHEFLEEAHSSLEEQQTSEADSSVLHKKEEEINSEIFSILKLLNHIKHRFDDCEAPFDKLFVKAMSLKEDSVGISEILQRELPLLEKIDKKLQDTLDDVNLTLIQKAVIQETHERFSSFLKKSKEINSHSKKLQEVKVIKKFMESMEAPMEHAGREHKIPCHLTSSCSSAGLPKCSEKVAASLYTSCCCAGMNEQGSQPRRTLTEISLVGSTGPENRGLYTPEDAASFLLSENQDVASENIIAGRISNQQRTLTEISLVGPSHLSSNTANKTSMLHDDTDSDVTQPPPPGVTPPPPGVTPPPPGVTPPPPGVSPPPPFVTSSPPHCVTSPPHPATPQPSSVTPKVTPSPSPSTTASQSVIISSSRASAPPHSVIPATAVTSSTNNATPSSSSSEVMLTSHRITRPSPEKSLSPSSDFTPLQAQACPQVSSVLANQLDNDKTQTGPQHSSTELTSSEQSCKPSVYKVTRMASVTDTPPQPSKEFLRSTIKDCFMSSSLPKESNVVTSTKGVLTSDTSNEESSIISLPSVSEDVLKMFEVKPEDIEKLNSGGKGRENDIIESSTIKPDAKKPIKITIPQFSKQKSLPKLNPITDGQEWL